MNTTIVCQHCSKEAERRCRNCGDFYCLQHGKLNGLCTVCSIRRAAPYVSIIISLFLCELMFGLFFSQTNSVNPICGITVFVIAGILGYSIYELIIGKYTNFRVAKGNRQADNKIIDWWPAIPSMWAIELSLILLGDSQWQKDLSFPEFASWLIPIALVALGLALVALRKKKVFAILMSAILVSILVWLSLLLRSINF